MRVGLAPSGVTHRRLGRVEYADELVDGRSASATHEQHSVVIGGIHGVADDVSMETQDKQSDFMDAPLQPGFTEEEHALWGLSNILKDIHNFLIL